jgi:toxin-antitoxin system PIN domain toxin
MSAALLDVNVLVALFDPSHIHHERAHRWLAAHSRQRWATCPITLNGCIRILSHPSYPTVRATPAEVIARLRVFCGKANHEFWPDDISLLDEARCRASKIANANQLTDVYLLALAVSKEGKLVTFDHGVSLEMVPGSATSHLEVLA